VNPKWAGKQRAFSSPARTMVSRTLPLPEKPHRKREVNETYRLRRFILNAHQNAFA
jgi:hypothetical protein